MSNHLYNYLLRLGDTNLILSHRLSENCSKGPYLEEDLAIANTGLDLLGAGEQFLIYAAQVSDEDITADDLAYKRIETKFYNLQLAELPNTDFAHIMARQFLMDVYNFYLYKELSSSKDETISAIAVKSLKEVTYHLRRSSEWMIRLGDGTDESHSRIQEALNHVWFYTNEIFDADETDNEMLSAGIGADLSKVKSNWEAKIEEILALATLNKPELEFFAHGSKKGIHTEHLGYLLAEMQYLPRFYADAKW